MTESERANKMKEYSRRVLLCRMRVLSTHPFFGLLLMHMEFNVSEEISTACTDGRKIIFSPKFLDYISDSELDFILMHEVLHVALQHCLRGKEYDNYLFNIACDIVVNSNILKANGMNKASITLRTFGESMHIAPNGREGYNYTAEEVYNMLLDKSKGRPKPNNSASGNNKEDSRSKKGSDNNSLGDDEGDGASGGGASGGLGNIREELSRKNGTDLIWDDHSGWGSDNDKELSDILVHRVMDAATAVRIQDPTGSRGLMPLAAERFFNELRSAENDWRTILASFIQEDVCDYSFSPPDRRYDSSGFYLPDYNEPEERVDNILFMIDTSGSMSDEMITNCYSEISGALEQFNGHLCGWLGFFDAVVVPPARFDSEEELKIIRPKGGGGTRFDIIFDYVRENMTDTPPVSIVILTDGYAPFPDESETDGIPVLWVINNTEVTPPYGRIARIS